MDLRRSAGGDGVGLVENETEVGRGGRVGKAGQRRAGEFAAANLSFLLLRLQPITQRNQLIHLCHDPLLLGEGWEGKWSTTGVFCSKPRQVHPVALGVSIGDELRALQGVAKIRGVNEAEGPNRDDLSGAVTGRVGDDDLVQIRPQLSVENIPDGKGRLRAL